MKPSSVQPKSKPHSDLARAIFRGRRNSRSTTLALGTTGILVVGVILWFAVGGPAQAQRAGPSFRTQPVQRGEISLTVIAMGNLEPTHEVTVGSELSGLVLEVYADANDRVTKGQKLVRFDTTSLENGLLVNEAELESAKAALLQSQATLEETRATLDRQRELRALSDGLIPSKAELLTAEAAAQRAQADVQSARAAIARAQAEIEITENSLSKAIIRSPVNGIVLTRSIEAGQTVAASFSAPELFVIAEDLAQMRLEVAVAEADIGRVKAGQKATFRVDAWPDCKYDAEVQKVSYGSQVTDNVVTYATELSVSNEDLSLRPGMTATVEIAVAHHASVLLVPVAALRFNPRPSGERFAEKSGGGFIDKLIPRPRRPVRNRPREPKMPLEESSTRVWLLEDGHPVPVEVRVGLSDGRFVEVSADRLSEGAPVILSQVI